MIDQDHLHLSARSHLAKLRNKHLYEVLHEQQLLFPIVQNLANKQLAATASFDQEETVRLFEQAWQGLSGPPPISFDDHWSENLSVAEQKLVEERIEQLKLQKRIGELYEAEVETYFLTRRPDLERVTYRAIRVKQQGLAEELYLRILNNEASFEHLASIHSAGEERLAGGLMGPMAISDPHSNIAAVLRRLSPGEMHAPIAVESWFLVLRMERREPASLNSKLKIKLQQELLQRDLQPHLEAVLDKVLNSTSDTNTNTNTNTDKDKEVSASLVEVWS